MENKNSTLKQYLFVINQINSKDTKNKTKETNLGFVWNIVNPLMYMIVLSIYYQNIIPHKIANYPVFIFSGVTIFVFYGNGTKGALVSIAKNKQLISRTKMPIPLFIIQKVSYAFKEFLFSSIALIPIMAYYGIRPTTRVLQIVPILLVSFLIVLGIGETLAVLYVYFADIEYFYSVFMTLMVFVSGVFIPMEHLPQKIQYILSFNPIFLSIYLTRNCLLYNLQSHWTAWFKLLLWMILSNLIGQYVIKKNGKYLVGRV